MAWLCVGAGMPSDAGIVHRINPFCQPLTLNLRPCSLHVWDLPIEEKAASISSARPTQLAL